MKHIKRSIIIVATLLLGCTPSSSYLLSNASYKHNDKSIEVSISKSNKRELLAIIADLEFNTPVVDQIYDTTRKNYDISFTLKDPGNDLADIYYFDIDTSMMLKALSSVSSMISDTFARVSADQSKQLIDIFKVVRENESKGIKKFSLITYFEASFIYQSSNNVNVLHGGYFPFIDMDKYDIKSPEIAGDVYNLFYTGELAPQLENSPAVFNSEKIEIVDVQKQQAEVYIAEALRVPESGNLNIILGNNVFHDFPTFVVNSNFSYSLTEDYQEEYIYIAFTSPFSYETGAIKAMFSYNVS